MYFPKVKNDQDQRIIAEQNRSSAISKDLWVNCYLVCIRVPKNEFVNIESVQHLEQDFAITVYKYYRISSFVIVLSLYRHVIIVMMSWWAKNLFCQKTFTIRIFLFEFMKQSDLWVAIRSLSVLWSHFVCMCLFLAIIVL